MQRGSIAGTARGGAVAVAVLGLLLLLPACGGTTPQATRTPAVPVAGTFQLELVVRTPAMLRSRGDVQRLVDSAAAHGFSTLSLLVKQDEDGRIESGRTYYPSAVAPRAPGAADFDVLQTVLDLAHSRGLRVQAWVPQFHDQMAARAHPQWAMRAGSGGQVKVYAGTRHTEYFVNPLSEDVQRYELALLQEITARYPVDGVMLDWIRFDDYPMDLSEATRARYRVLTGVDPVAIDFARDTPQRAQWNEFRTAAIAGYVARVRAALPADVALGVYILPPDFVEVGQDAARFTRDVQSLAPMCYHRDWGYPLAWVWERCVATALGKAGSTPVAPTLDANLPDHDVRQVVHRIRADFPAVRTLVWFEHEAWTDANLARLARLSAGG